MRHADRPIISNTQPHDFVLTAFNDGGDRLRPTVESGGLFGAVESSIVATGCATLVPDMPENRFDNMWHDPEAIMHRRRNQPSKIVQGPVGDARRRRPLGALQQYAGRDQSLTQPNR